MAHGIFAQTARLQVQVRFSIPLDIKTTPGRPLVRFHSTSPIQVINRCSSYSSRTVASKRATLDHFRFKYRHCECDIGGRFWFYSEGTVPYIPQRYLCQFDTPQPVYDTWICSDDSNF